MSVIEDLGKAFLDVSGVKGIDWEMPAYNAPDGAVIAGYVLQMNTAALELTNIAVQLDIWPLPTPEEAKKAVNEIKSDLSGSADSIFQALSQGSWSLASDEVVRLKTTQLRRMIAANYLLTDAGMALHYPAKSGDSRSIVYRLVQNGSVSREMVMEHADRLVRTARSIKKLYDTGNLDSLKKGAVSGPLGFDPVTITIIAVAGVLLLLGLAYLISVVVENAKTQELLVAECKKLKDPAAAAACLQASKTNPLAEALGAGFGTLGTVAIAGIAIYVGAKYALPQIIAAVERYRSRAHA